MYLKRRRWPWRRHSQNLQFDESYTEDSPYVQLRLLQRVAANEELKMDYGEAYPYAARGFTR